MTGYESKRAAARDKLLVTDIDGHVVRDARKPKKAELNRDAEIERLNEKIEFLARTNMLYSDWEHRETQVTSDLIRKGIEEAKINAELRAEIAELKAQLVTQPEEEKLHPVSIGVDVTQAGTSVTAFYRKPDAVMEMFYAQFHPMPPPPQEPVTWAGVDFDINTTPPQPAQEPVAWRYRGNLHEFDPSDWATGPVTPLYTTPPQRPWVGLTKEAIAEFGTWYDNREEETGWVPPSEIVAYIETKLKEKNT